MEALLELIPNYPWKEAENPETGESCVIVADDDAAVFPSSIIEAFGTDNTALAPYIALAHNLMPRLIAELRRRRGEEHVSHE
jgi:hypothetical protein